MTMRKLLFAIAPLLLLTSFNAIHAQTKKPNIILIMADDLGYETIGANGGTSYQTPRIDELARSGMRFENCHASPLCTPSRVKLMTGKYNFRNYVGFGVLDPKELTFGHLLQDAGYVTGVTGKWQLLGLEGEQRDAGRRGTYPVEAGFDEYCLWQVEQRLSRYKDPVVTTMGNETKTLTGKFGPDVFSAFAKDFIKRHRDTTFFLYYPMVLVHSPFQPVPGSPGYDAIVDDKNPNDPTHFAAMVAYMDKIVGELYDEVKTQGLTNNTLFIFMGDNGTDESVTSVINGKTVRGGKSGHGSNATHVPFIASWKGVVKPGSVNKNLVDFTDFLPTFLEVAGAKPPLYFFTDGIAFYDQLRGKQEAKSREYVFCSYDPKRGKRDPGTWIHNKEWKLYQTGEFFNLIKDPEEKTPLSPGNLGAAGTKAKAQLEQAMNGILGK